MMGRAVLFHGPNRPLELARFPVPEPRGAELRVRVSCCTLCSSDLHTHAGRRQEPTPAVLGHEIVGRIDAIGPDAPRTDWRGAALAIGDRITWSVAVHCGQCFFCAEGLPQKCEHLFKYGHQPITPERPFTGGLAEFVLLQAGTVCLRLPDALPDLLAAPASCATATVAAVLRSSGGTLSGKTVLIFGAGMLGLTASAMAHAAGANAVLVCERDPARRARAAEFGATHLLSPPETPAGRGADLVLELAGTAESVQTALSQARIGGTVILAGTVAPTAAMTVDPEMIVRRMLTIRGVHNYAPIDLAAAVDFLAGSARGYPFAFLIGPTFTLDEVEQAFAYSHAHPGLRVAVVP